MRAVIDDVVLRELVLELGLDKMLRSSLRVLNTRLRDCGLLEKARLQERHLRLRHQPNKEAGALVRDSPGSQRLKHFTLEKRVAVSRHRPRNRALYECRVFL